MYDKRILRASIPARCPACTATFDPFLRGQVAETFLMFPTGRTCLICYACKEIVGHESVEGGYRLLNPGQIGRPPLPIRFGVWFSDLVQACMIFAFGLACLTLFLVCWTYLALVWLLLVLFSARSQRPLP